MSSQFKRVLSMVLVVLCTFLVLSLPVHAGQEWEKGLNVSLKRRWFWKSEFFWKAKHYFCHQEFQGKIDIGGYGLYVHSEGRGKPSILFDSGYGMDSGCWEGIQKKLSKEAKTVSYDRAGVGKSDASPYERTSLQIVHEWHKMLKKLKVKGPYILVGHSYGGFNVRLFASQYPDEVAGIILVDASHEDQDSRLVSSLPLEIQEQMKGQFCIEGTYDDFLRSADQVRAAKESLKNIPLIVISATKHGLGQQAEEVWMELQKDMANLSSRSKHRVINDTGHFVHVEKPEVVVQAIRDMMKMVKKCNKGRSNKKIRIKIGVLNEYMGDETCIPFLKNDE